MSHPPAKKRRKEQAEDLPIRPATPGDLELQTLVLYGEDGRRGRIHDAFEAVDAFWVEDEETGDVVRDENGKIVDFPSTELWLPLAKDEEAQLAAVTRSAGVLLLGTEEQMTLILQHMGPSSYEERQEPQSLLAVPCNVVDPAELKQLCTDGVEEELIRLARSLRSDIGVSLRILNLKQVLLRLGSELPKLQASDYFYLASVNLPYGWDAIEAAPTPVEARRRRDVCNQIEVGVTAFGQVQGTFPSPVDAARGAMGEKCGIEVSDILWQTQVQARLRADLGAPALPTQIEDSTGSEIFPVILPQDAVVTKIKGVLVFGEAPGAWYLTGPRKPEEKVQGKTVREWEALQSEFRGEPPLPRNWLRIKSRSSGQVYYFNRETQKSQFELPQEPVERKVEAEKAAPAQAASAGDRSTGTARDQPSKRADALPKGWTQHISKRNGKIYYFHKATNISQYYRPKE